MFGEHFLIKGDFVVRVAFSGLFGLGDHAGEVVVAEEKDTEQVAGGLIGWLEFHGVLCGGDGFFCNLLVWIFHLRERFGVEILEQGIVGMKLALLREESKGGGAVVFLAEEHTHSIFGEGKLWI